MRPPAIAIVLASVAALATGCKRKPGDETVSRVWLGATHGCVEVGVAAKELRCWGEFAADGTHSGRPRPTTLPLMRELAFGREGTCGIDLEGHVRCWGVATPDVAKDATGPLVFSQIAANGGRFCGIAGGRVRCWGDPVDVPSGEGMRAIAVTSNGVCAADAASVVCGAKVYPIEAKVLAAGDGHVCALSSRGEVLCWGRNDVGQVGDGATRDVPEPASVLEGVVGLAAGARFTCARFPNRTVNCWGDNRFHELVDGTTESRPRPTTLQGLLGVEELALAGASGCARLGDASVRCWGKNDVSQLGDDRKVDHDVPMPLRF